MTVHNSKLEAFPVDGNVRAKEAAKHLRIGLSTWWLWVKQGKLPQPVRLGSRTSVWKASVVRDIAENGFKEGAK